MKQKDIDRVAKFLVNLKLPKNARIEPKPTKKDLEEAFVLRINRNGKQAEMARK